MISYHDMISYDMILNKKNDGYSVIIGIIIINYRLKKNGLWDKLWICKEKNDVYSIMIFEIYKNYGTEKNISFRTNNGFAKKK